MRASCFWTGCERTGRLFPATLFLPALRPSSEVLVRARAYLPISTSLPEEAVTWSFTARIRRRGQGARWIGSTIGEQDRHGFTRKKYLESRASEPHKISQVNRTHSGRISISRAAESIVHIWLQRHVPSTMCPNDRLAIILGSLTILDLLRFLPPQFSEDPVGGNDAPFYTRRTYNRNRVGSEPMKALVK